MNDSFRRGTSRALATAIGTIAISLIGVVASAGQRDDLHADAALQRDADLLQRCLESQFPPWQLESTLSTNGRIADTVRVTRWGASSGHRCVPPRSTRDVCDAPHGLQRIVNLEFVAGEPHPAWSVNDRVRLEDLIPATLTKLAGNVRLRPVDGRSVSEGNDVLRVRLDYRGVTTPQRDAEDWIIAPRKLLVTMTLVEDPSRSGRTISSRVIDANQGLQFRGRHSSTSSSSWMTRVLDKVDATAKTMVKPLGCEMPWLNVSMDRNKIWLVGSQYTGLQQGRSVLLVPSVDTALASRWPIAKIGSISREGRAELALVRGSAGLCDGGCRAIPL